MTERVWLSSYPQGVPADIDTAKYPSLVALLEESFQKYADRVAYNFMGKDVTFGQTDSLSLALSAYLQGLGLVKGDRVAIMMPNVPQYPIAVAAILRAGFVVVNVNPLYTARELEHQLKDSGSKAIVIIENFAHTLEKCIAATPVKHVVLCAMGDRLGLLKGTLVNYVVRNVKKWCRLLVCPTLCDLTTRWLVAPRRHSSGQRSKQTTSLCCNTPVARRVSPKAPCFCIAM